MIAPSNSVRAESPLRLRVAQLRQDLAKTTAAYRLAAAQHDASQSIVLLRSRSHLMRELLNAQCELLLSLRTSSASEFPGGEGVLASEPGVAS